MNTKTIFTENYILLIISEEVPFLIGEIGVKWKALEPKHRTLTIADEGNRLSIQKHWRKCLAYKKLNPEAPTLPLPILPDWDEEVDINKIAFQELFPLWDNRDILEQKEWAMLHSFVLGFKKAPDLAKDKLFTLEDIEKAIELAREYTHDSAHGDHFHHTEEEIIQQLKQSKVPKYFVPELKVVPDNNNYGSGEIFSSNMKEILKTIDTPEGPQVVGKWKF